jgi:prevent-host-death family protein
MPEEIGIRELRQNLSTVIERVKKGERLVVTDHNRPVAELIPHGLTGLDRMIAEGRLRPAKNPNGPLPEPIDVGDPEAGTRALRYVRGG